MCVIAELCRLHSELDALFEARAQCIDPLDLALGLVRVDGVLHERLELDVLELVELVLVLVELDVDVKVVTVETVVFVELVVFVDVVIVVRVVTVVKVVTVV